MSTSTTIIILTALALLIALIFNRLISRKNQLVFAFAAIDVQLKKRYYLIPNLVAICEKYLGYEHQTLQQITAIRSQALQSGPQQQAPLDAQLSNQLRSVFALSENYPELKAAEQFALLQRSLNEVEEQLAAARRAFNAAVFAYNNAIQMFPGNLAARLLGYQEKPSFEIQQAEREPIKIWS